MMKSLAGNGRAWAITALALQSCWMATAVAAPPAPASTAPGAGNLLQQIPQVVAPEQRPGGTGLRLERPADSALPQSVAFAVRAIAIAGNTQFDTATLHGLVADAEGSDLDLAQLGTVVARITAYYQSHGFPLARAIIPAQTVEGGRVKVQVIEAHYGAVHLQNHSRVNDQLLHSTLGPLQPGDPVEQHPLDRTLLLLSDIPGAQPSATIKPGDAAGTSDLDIDIEAGPYAVGNAGMDNTGNAYTGRVHANATVSLFSPLHDGDVASINVLASDANLQYGRLTYETLAHGSGTRVGASCSGLHYVLGPPLDVLRGSGSAQVDSLWVRQPWLRSPSLNANAQFQWDHKQLNDRLAASRVFTDRHLDNFGAVLSGDARDSPLAGAGTNWSVIGTYGWVGFADPGAQAADRASARTRGSFVKWTANFSRLQILGPHDALALSLTGQWANGNLDAAEKMVAGGAATVRGYDTGVLSGDSGFLRNLEWRHDLPFTPLGGAQLHVYYDRERLDVDKRAWAPGRNSATLSGIGLGLSWIGSNGWSARATLATAVGPRSELLASARPPRAWLQISRDLSWFDQQ
jgi:hemolysin activation/secretion protein